MLIAGVLQKDAFSRLISVETGAMNFNGGTPVTDLGELLVASSGGVVHHAGLLFTIDGYLVVASEGVTARFTPDSLPVDSAGRLCVAFGGTPFVFNAGIPFDINSRVCLVGGVVPCVAPLFTMDTPVPTFGTVPLLVQFGVTYVSGTGPFTYLWDFGDGNSSALQNPLHNYTVAGDYDAEVTITNACGSLELTAGTVSPGAPVEPFYILQEIGDNILTEIGEFLEQEDGSGGGVVIAPAFAAGNDGIPVINAHPHVGNLLTMLAADVTGTAPTQTWQWYRARVRGGAGVAIPGAVANYYVPTDADTMHQIWAVQTETNSAGTVSVESWRCTCMPAGWSVGSGAPTYTSHTSDPDDSTLWSATGVYMVGQPVERSGSKYICRVPYSVGQDPAVSTTDAEGVMHWQIVPTSNGVFYIDPTLGNDANAGTKAAPWQTIDAIRKKVLRATPGFSVAAQNAIFLIKQGETLSGSLTVNVFTDYPNTNLGTAAKFVFGKYGAGTTRPIWNWGPMLQTVYDVTSVTNFHLDTNANGVLICDIDFRSAGIGEVRLRAMPSLVGTFADNDAVTFASNGATGTVTESFNKGGFVYYIVAMTAGTVQNGTLMTGPSGSMTVGTVGSSDILYIGGIGGTGNDDWNVARCRLQDIAYNGITPGGVRHTFMHNDILRAFSQKDTGGGIDGGGDYCNFWFNTITDCGYEGNILGHNLYLTGGDQVSAIGNLSQMSANFGNHALVLHGNWSNGEVAYNKGIGTRSGWGPNDGYGSNEAMTNFHWHHNMLENIGKFTGQSSASLGWEVTGIDGMRIHDNVSINTTDSAWYEDRNSGGTDTLLKNVVMGHNSFYRCKAFIGAFLGGLATGMTDIDWRNNAFTNNEAKSALSKGFSMVDGQLTLDFNAYYRSDASTVISWNVGGAAANYSTAAALNAAVPAFEDNGVTGDPLFVNVTPGSYDLALQALSPLRNAGTDMRRALGWNGDFTGVARPATPHIGAYQTS